MSALRRGATITVALASAIALSAGVAAASWSKAGAGSGAGKATALTDATSPAATRLSSTSARISWTNGANPGGARYRVVRSAGAGSPLTVCASTTAGPCDDTTASGTSVAYTIQTIIPSTSWNRPAISAGTVALTATTYILTMTSSSATQGTNNWRATVNMTLVDNIGTPLSGYAVAGSWSAGSGGGCPTAANGTCSATSGNIGNATASSTFTVTGVTKSGSTLTQDATSQTTVTANKP